MDLKSSIPTAAIVGVVTLMIVGEISSGTGLPFVAMMAGTVFCVAITYNLLGGLGTFGGILFAAFSLRTIVISQFGKVVLFEAADKNIEAPQLTIAVYLVFYLSLMLGVFTFGKLRFDLPKPVGSATRAQTNVLYILSLAVGAIASLAFQITSVLGAGGTADSYGQARSFGVAFSALLLLALVVAVDSRIRYSDGSHSFGIAASIPWFLAMVFGFFDTSRAMIAAPTLAYFVTCYVRGYRFKRRHYLAGALGMVLFVFFVSPFEIYSRGFLEHLTFRDRAYAAIYLLRTVPDLRTVELATQQAEESGEGRSGYFSHAGTFVLGRFSLISPDSALINACSGGFHYGWTTIDIDILHNLPRLLYKNKPESDSSAYLGRVTGMNPDWIENSEASFSPISDMFGAFGWMGVISFSFFAFPAMFIIFESVFDMSQPWGTVALGLLLPNFAEGGAGNHLVNIVRVPVYVVLLSRLLGGISGLLATRGDQEFIVSAMPDEKTAIS